MIHLNQYDVIYLAIIDEWDAIRRLKESGQLIQDTVQMQEEAVAAQSGKIHAGMVDPLHYHNEQSLRSVIQIAYYSYPDCGSDILLVGISYNKDAFCVPRCNRRGFVIR